MNRHERRIIEKNRQLAENKREMSNEEQVSVLKQAVETAKAGRGAEAAHLCEQLCSRVVFGDIAFTAAKLWAGLEPESYKAWNNYGLLCLNNGNTERAIKVSEKALEIKPDGVDAIMTLCNAWHKAGNFKKAKEYNDLLFFKYNMGAHAYVIEARARILWDMGLRDEAIALAARLVKLIPEETVSNNLIGRMMIETEREEEALPYILKCRDLKPNLPVYTYNLALAYDAVGKTEKARNEFIKALKLFDANDPEKRNFAFEREKIASLAGGSDKKFKIYKMDGFDNTDDNTPFIDSVRKLSENHEIIEMSSVRTPANEWVILFGDKAYIDMMMTNDEHMVKGFRNRQTELVLNEDFPEHNYDEPCVLLGGAINYYHWLCDYLPRMELIDAVPELKGLPIIVQHEMKQYHIDSLKTLGYDPARFVCAPRRHYLKFKKVFIPHIKYRQMKRANGYSFLEPALKIEELQWIRRKFAPFMKPRNDLPKRIFISRAGAKFRRCENEDAVYELARRYGFEKVQNENMSFADQIAMYAGAEAVMGAHGAGFTNMIFAPEGSSLIELFPMAAQPKFFVNICAYLKHNHYRIDGVRTLSQGISAREFWDFEVDLNDVKNVLDKLGKPV